jgi:hypothetical protein
MGQGSLYTPTLLLPLLVELLLYNPLTTGRGLYRVVGQLVYMLYPVKLVPTMKYIEHHSSIST